MGFKCGRFYTSAAAGAAAAAADPWSGAAPQRCSRVTLEYAADILAGWDADPAVLAAELAECETHVM